MHGCQFRLSLGYRMDQLFLKAALDAEAITFSLRWMKFLSGRCFVGEPRRQSFPVRTDVRHNGHMVG